MIEIAENNEEDLTRGSSHNSLFLFLL